MRSIERFRCDGATTLAFSVVGGLVLGLTACLSTSPESDLDASTADPAANGDNGNIPILGDQGGAAGTSTNGTSTSDGSVVEPKDGGNVDTDANTTSDAAVPDASGSSRYLFLPASISAVGA